VNAALDPAILAPAFAAGLLVLATHVPLGQEVLRRGIVFADLAIAQVAGLGVIAVAAASGGALHGPGVQLAAAAAALLGAALLQLFERRWPRAQEALIGVLFVLSASLAVLLLADHPHGAEHMNELLVGQILWVTPADLLPVALLSALLALAWFTIARPPSWLFYVLLALAVTASVQLVGVYLVFASLIVPALGARGRTPARRLASGYAIGAAGYALGILGSALLDLPTAACVVCTLVATGLAAGGWRRA
jgi:zinc/manganese transport system permease protein